MINPKFIDIFSLTTCASNSSWQPSMLLHTLLFLGLSSSPGLPSQMVTLPLSEGEAFWWRIALSGIRSSLWNAEDSFRVEPMVLLGLRLTKACGWLWHKEKKWEQQHCWYLHGYVTKYGITTNKSFSHKSILFNFTIMVNCLFSLLAPPRCKLCS